MPQPRLRRPSRVTDLVEPGSALQTSPHRPEERARYWVRLGVKPAPFGGRRPITLVDANVVVRADGCQFVGLAYSASLTRDEAEARVLAVVAAYEALPESVPVEAP